MLRNNAQRVAWWWPLALAIFILSAWAAIVLSSGTAHADDGAPSSAGDSQAEKPIHKPTNKLSDKSTASDDKPASTPKTSVGSTPGNKGTDDSEPAKASKDPDTKSSERPSDVPPNGSIVRHDDMVASKTGATKDEQPQDDPTDEPPNTRLSNVSDLTPRLAAKNASQAIPGSASEPPAASKIVPSTVVPSNIVALPTAQPAGVGASAVAITPQQQFEQFVRQIAGLLTDTGVIAASLVNNIAVEIATAIGPEPFFGVPYAVTNAIAKTAGNVSKVLTGTPLDATSEGPFAVDYGVMDVLSTFTPGKVPAGANDDSIGITKEHPLPVILINGTIETQSLNWAVGAPVLANAGYKVFTFNYGNITPFPDFPFQSTEDISKSAVELSKEIDRVLELTGAPKVILVGHSQGGGILPAYYLNVMGGADKVSQLIGLAPSNHGTDFNGLVNLQGVPILGPLVFGVVNLLGQALGQQLVTSPFQQVVYGNGDTRPGVLYTTIASTNDEIVTPYTQQALDGPAVTNIVLQDLYSGFPAGHIGVAFSSRSWASVLDALAANPQANPLLDPILNAA